MSHLPIADLTPQQIVAELDKYIIGQEDAKKAVAVALRNRYRRQQLPFHDRDDIMPKNILMIGPTGVGKTEIARRLAQIAHAPLVKVEATKFTEVGYVGRDVDSMIRDLVSAAVRLVERERIDEIEAEAMDKALRKIAEQLYTEDEPVVIAPKSDDIIELDTYYSFPNYDEAKIEKLIEEIKAGVHDKAEVEVDIEEQSNPFLQVFTPGGMEEMGMDMFGGANSPFNKTSTITRKMRVMEAKAILAEAEAKNMIDQNAIHKIAVERAEQTGIIFIDEIDKVAIKSGGSGGPEVSREGVQRDLLPVIEGSSVPTKFGTVRTDHILFICAGAFHMAKPSDLIPELQGRLPIRVELKALTEDDFGRILREPKNALVKQYEKLLSVDGVTIEFTAEALDELAHYAVELNNKVENIGARRLHTLMEKLLEDLLFDAPYGEPKHVVFDIGRVRNRIGEIVGDAVKGQRLL